MKTLAALLNRYCVLTLLCFSSGAMADDTELYVLNVTSDAGVQPRVMIIFDNSGSMSNNVYSVEPFTPTTTYTKIYWSSSSRVPSTDSSSYFYASKNNCHTSISALNSVGFYSSKFLSLQSKTKRGNTTWSWSNLNKDYRDSYVDCLSDVTESDTSNPANNATGYPKDSPSSESTAYSATKNSGMFDSANATYLFTSDYVSWYNNPVKTNLGTRLSIAKKTIDDLIVSTPSVDYGLATFNNNEGGDYYGNNDDGGRIVFASKNANDTTDTTDTNAGFRQSLRDIISKLTSKTYTPLAEALYEVAHYWQGGDIVYGKWAGWWEAENWWSAPTYNTATPAYDASAMNSGKTKYITPFDTCHNHGYIIYMTDGAPTNDSGANTRITSEFINSTKLTTNELSDWGSTFSYNSGKSSSYLPALAGYLNHKDLISTLDGDQTVTTYTIGFGDDAMANAEELLSEAAKRGGGKYFPAADATALGDALRNIIVDILSGQYSMLAPTTASSTLDRSQYLDNLYYSLFTPSSGPSWVGNIKKLKFSSDGSYIADVNGNPAISSSGKIMSTATTYWSTVTGDGAKIDQGGVQGMLANKTAERKLLTNNGTSLVDLTKVNLTTIAGTSAAVTTALGLTDAADIDDQISWIQGKDVDGSDPSINRKNILGDMMHSKPFVLNYGIKSPATEPDLRLIVGTNAGFLHMFKDSGTTVDESWAFIPYDLLANQTTLRNNSTGMSHVYGLDGSPSAYILDKNNDGIISSSGASGDKAWIFIGQREGGRSYYAFDVTNPDSPSIKWKITGGATTGFDRLGYTWATPQVTSIPGETDPVVIFTGGYTGSGATSGVGNAIYFVNANTGALVFKVSPDAQSTTNLSATDMTGAIPGGVTLLDSDSDGVTDRLYAADTNGTVWRMDMNGTDKTKWSIFDFAVLADQTKATEKRKFFSAPTVARTFNHKVTSSNGVVSTADVPFDAVLLGSGDRQSPASEKTIQNGYFMLRDYNVGKLSSTSTKPDAIVVDDLYDITTMPDVSASSVLINLTNKSGWKYWLGGTGEKVFGAGSVVNGTLYFTSFLPEASKSQDICTLGNSIGTTKLYEFNMHYGTYSGSAYTTVNDLLVDNLAIFVTSDKKIRLLGGPGDKIENKESYTGTTLTSGSTLPRRVYQYLHE